MRTKIYALLIACACLCSYALKAATISNPLIIEISGVINDSIANEIQSILLEHEKKTFENAYIPVRIIINSPGGSLYPTLGITDTMGYVSFPVETECSNMAASAASLVLAMGNKGHRFAHKNSRILIHYATADNQANCNEANIELEKLNQEILSMLASQTNKTIKEIEIAIKDANGELWLTAEEAKEFGIIDKILE